MFIFKTPDTGYNSLCRIRLYKAYYFVKCLVEVPHACHSCVYLVNQSYWWLSHMVCSFVNHSSCKCVYNADSEQIERFPRISSSWLQIYAAKCWWRYCALCIFYARTGLIQLRIYNWCNWCRLGSYVTTGNGAANNKNAHLACENLIETDVRRIICTVGGRGRQLWGEGRRRVLAVGVGRGEGS